MFYYRGVFAFVMHLIFYLSQIETFLLNKSINLIFRHVPCHPSIWTWINSIKKKEETTAINIEQEEHQNRLTRPRHRCRIKRDNDLLNLKKELENHVIDFDEYCRRLRHFSYAYLDILEAEK